MDAPQYDGPRLVTLLDGTLVFNDSEPWKHLCEARSLANMTAHDRTDRLWEIERMRGPEAVARLRRTIDEVISVTATGAR